MFLFKVTEGEKRSRPKFSIEECQHLAAHYWKMSIQRILGSGQEYMMMNGRM